MTRINIDDDMIKRFIGAGGCYQRGKTVHESVRMGLQAALDRRTGPKDRRVEYDDENSYQRRGFSDFNGRGRRDGDVRWINHPRKSDRLKREAEEREKQKAQEIHVSYEMISEGAKAYDDHGFMFGKGSTSQGVFECVYRAMRLQEMKERGQ